MAANGYRTWSFGENLEGTSDFRVKALFVFRHPNGMIATEEHGFVGSNGDLRALDISTEVYQSEEDFYEYISMHNITLRNKSYDIAHVLTYWSEK